MNKIIVALLAVSVLGFSIYYFFASNTNSPGSSIAFNCGGYTFEYPSGWHAWSEKLDDVDQCLFSNLREEEITPHGSIPKNSSEAVVIVQVRHDVTESVIEQLKKGDCRGEANCNGSTLLNTSTVSFRNVDVVKVVSQDARGDIPGEGDIYEAYYYEDGDTLVSMFVDWGNGEHKDQALAVISSLKRK